MLKWIKGRSAGEFDPMRYSLTHSFRHPQFNLRRHRTLQYLLLACVCCILSSTLLGCGQKSSRPNIILFVLDTVRRDATGLGSENSRWQNLTPHLDRLAAEGTAYPHAWATAPWTVPSHASIFTGLLPLTHGCIAKHPQLGKVGPTSAELLADAGYATAAFFSNPWLTDRTTGLLRGFELRQETPIGGLTKLTGDEGDQGGRQIIRNAAHWLHNRNKSEPFFVFVNILEAHMPYDPPADYRKRYLPHLPEDAGVPIAWAHEYNAELHPDDTVDWQAIWDLYAGDVNYADWLLGELINILKQMNLYEETVLIITSDHGENLGEHRLVEHQFSIHETLLAVPLVIHAPESTLPHGIRLEPVMLTDLYPTILDLAGISYASLPSQGLSLLKDHASRTEERPLFADYSDPSRVLLKMLQDLNPSLDMRRFTPAWRTVRVGNLRLTAGSDGTILLHNLESDPGQKNNLAGSQPGSVRLLANILQKAESAKREEIHEEELQLDPQTREQLRSLGYIR